MCPQPKTSPNSPHTQRACRNRRKIGRLGERVLLDVGHAEPIPQVVSDLLFAHLCETGGYTVEYRKHPGTAEQANLDNEPYLLSWLDGRVAGSDAPTTPCP